MFAVIADGGRQYRVEAGKRLRVDYRETLQAGEKIQFSEVLLAGSNSAHAIGRPLLADAVVEAEVLRHEKGEKLEIGKHKRRKNMRRHTGHRQKYTIIQIKTINVPGVPEDAQPAPAPAPVTEPAAPATDTPATT